MGGSKLIHVVRLAARGRLAVEILPVPRSLSDGIRPWGPRRSQLLSKALRSVDSGLRHWRIIRLDRRRRSHRHAHQCPESASVQHEFVYAFQPSVWFNCSLRGAINYKKIKHLLEIFIFGPEKTCCFLASAMSRKLGFRLFRGAEI